MVKKSDGKNTLIVPRGKTKDIIKVILEIAKEPIERQTAQFSKRFFADRGGLTDLWDWVKYNINYKEDPDGLQWVKTPARLYNDKVGDCKSFTLFIVSVLRNMGVPYLIRFVSYDRNDRNVTHVYPVAILDGKEVIMDAVWHHFDSEKTPYYHKKDYDMTKIYKLSGIGKGGELRHKKLSIETPKRVYYPISVMTEGELQVALAARKQDLLQNINYKRNHHAAAEKQRRTRDNLLNKLAKGMHNIGKLPTDHQSVRILLKANGLDAPAVAAHYEASQSITGNYTEYTTPEQEWKCKAEALQKLGLLKYYKDNEINPPGPFNSKNWVKYLQDKGLWDAWQRHFKQCLMPLAFEQLINEKMEKTGVAFLYDSMRLQSDQGVKRIVSMKAFEAQSWIQTSSNVTGMSKEAIRGFIENGIIASDLQKTPEEIRQIVYKRLKDQPHNGIGEPLTIATVTLIVTLVAAAAKATVSIISALKGDFGSANQVLNTIAGPENFKPSKVDYEVAGAGSGTGTGTGNGTSTEGENSILNTALLAGGAYGLYQIFK